MKKATSLMWQYLIPLILALIVFLAMFGPGVTWVKDSWKKLSDKVGSLWKREAPKTVDPGKQITFDAFNTALRDNSKIITNQITHSQFTALLNNMEYLQEMQADGNVKVHLLKTTPGNNKPLYLIYRADGAGPVSLLGWTFATDDITHYTLSDASGAYTKKLGGNSASTLLTALNYRCEVDRWFDYDIQMILSRPQDCCAKVSYCPNVKLKEVVEASIAKAPKK